MTTPAEQNVKWVICDELYTPYRKHFDAALKILGSQIQEMMPTAEMPAVEKNCIIHLPGAIVAPGFIDLHIHGALGHDFMDGSRETVRTVSRTVARFGTTSFVATLMSAPAPQIESAIRNLAGNLAAADGAIPVGIHMEGPFLNPARRGAHDGSALRKADLQAFRGLSEICGHAIRRLTLAPELDSEFELIRAASAMGVQVSIGHSDATVVQAHAAIDAGATSATHTFNAMRPFHQREPGILGAVLTDERIYAEVIADFVHVHPTALKLLIRMKGTDRILLVSDGTSAVGMGDGTYPLGNRSITVKNGECRDSDGKLAGSILTLDRAVRNLVHLLDVPLGEALIAVSAAPARCMQIADRKGIIAAGADADLVFLDPKLQVIQTMVGGRIVYPTP